ncbi:MAG TPA: ADP-ribosylglycohydrolase family protein [Pseudonocardiaceae bacterium]|jgi:ADP-ribosylglycohydrolase|nr:ADP-ribosylglycohydrolase family protein [Pseudonocardiaceae bacterium]
MTNNDPTRLALAFASLTGLSVGDALGAQYFVPGRSFADLTAGRLPTPPWEWTDDTEMACTVLTELAEHHQIDQGSLAATFADRCEPYRGYGPGAVVILHRIRDGVPWRQAAGEVFDGTGSCGNGAAMRVAPLGAWFFDDLDRAAEQAVRSAEVTHAHPEGIAGAVAVALAASIATRPRIAPVDLIDGVRHRTPPGQVRDGIERAAGMLGRSIAEAGYELGNGARVTAQDTVPFAIWSAATHLGDYPAAIRSCVEIGGDVDTMAAIVGGIVAADTGSAGIPAEWRAAREPLPEWVR